MSISADDNIPDAFTVLEADAVTSGTPAPYSRAVRSGAPGSRHRITVNGHPAHITIRTQSPGPRRDADSFTQLRGAMAAAIVDGIQPELPTEISMVVWQQEGREVRICAPGTAPALRRARDRIRRRLTALSPLPILGALAEPLAGSATAVGIAVAPVLAPVHPVTPPPAHVREMTGQYAGTSSSMPGTLNIPRPLPAPTETVAADHEAIPGVPDQTPPVLPTAPLSATPTPTVDTPASAEPSPVVTGGEVTDAAPIEQPTDVPADTPAATTEASASPTVSPHRRLLQPRHQHHHKPRRYLPGLRWGR